MASKIIETTKYGPEVCQASLDCQGKCLLSVPGSPVITPHIYYGYCLRGLKLQTKYIEHWFRCIKCNGKRIWGTAWITDELLEKIQGEIAKNV